MSNLPVVESLIGEKTIYGFKIIVESYNRELRDLRAWTMWSFYMALLSCVAWVWWIFCEVVK